MVKKIKISQQAKYTCFFCGKTKMKRHLALWLLHENGSWWYLDLHHFCHHSKVSHQKTQGIEGTIEAPPMETLLAYDKWVNLCNNNNKKDK
uniref:Uncharacterized protein n=2 Tax=Sus scrofa TaxID=9823 RepID=A0A4X1T3J5_PIG